MGAAALADIIDVRVMYLIGSLLILISRLWVLFLPGLRQDAADGGDRSGLLHSAPSAPGLGIGRIVTWLILIL